MLSIFQAVLEEEGSLSRLIIDERDGMPSPSSYRHRFGGLLRAYSLIGYAPDHDYEHIEIKPARDSFPGLLNEIAAGPGPGAHLRARRREFINHQLWSALVYQTA